MNPVNLLTQEQAELRRLEDYLINRISQLDRQLEELTESQEHLVIVEHYLKDTEAPFIVLSYFSTVEWYIHRQSQELLSLSDISHDLIRLVRQLKWLKSPFRTDPGSFAQGSSSNAVARPESPPAEVLSSTAGA
jgi:hypothetical protein